MLYVKTDGSISLTRGDTAQFQVSIENKATGQAYVVQPTDTIRMTLKKTTKDASYLFQKVSTGTNIIDINPEDTNGLAFGKYVFDVQLTTSDNKVYTVTGPNVFTILEEVTTA